jgi:hypothetical protein
MPALFLLLLCLHLLLQSAPGAAEGDPTQEPTGLPLTTLQRVGNAICQVPEGFNCHPDVSALLLQLARKRNITARLQTAAGKLTRWHVRANRHTGMSNDRMHGSVNNNVDYL